MAVFPLVPVRISAFFPNHVREHALPDVARGIQGGISQAKRHSVLDIPASLALGIHGKLRPGMGGAVQFRLLQHHAHLIYPGACDDGSVQAANLVRLLPHGHHDAGNLQASLQEEIAPYLPLPSGRLPCVTDALPRSGAPRPVFPASHAP